MAPRRPNRPRRSRCQSTGPPSHRRLTTRHVAPRRRTGPRWSSRRPRGGSRRRLRSGAPAPMFHLWPALLIWTYLPRAWLGRRSCRRSIMVGRRWCRGWSVIRGSSCDAGAISAISTHDLGDSSPKSRRILARRVSYDPSCLADGQKRIAVVEEANQRRCSTGNSPRTSPRSCVPAAGVPVTNSAGHQVGWISADCRTRTSACSSRKGRSSSRAPAAMRVRSARSHTSNHRARM